MGDGLPTFAQAEEAYRQVMAAGAVRDPETRYRALLEAEQRVRAAVPSRGIGSQGEQKQHARRVKYLNRLRTEVLKLETGFPGIGSTREEFDPHNDYELVKRLTCTNLGAVWRARHRQTGAAACCKLSLWSGMERNALESPTNEGHLLQELQKQPHNHPHIVRYVDEYLTNRAAPGEYYWCVMEYCDGGTLLDFVALSGNVLHAPGERGERAWGAVVQAVEVVAHIHERGYAHLDIKPENFLMTADATLRLSDFGTMKRMEPPEAGVRAPCRPHQGRIGTIPYMAPEVLYNRAFLPHLADSWSLGLVLFRIVLGRHPHEIHAQQRQQQQAQQNPSRPPQPPQQQYSHDWMFNNNVQRMLQHYHQQISNAPQPNPRMLLMLSLLQNVFVMDDQTRLPVTEIRNRLRQFNSQPGGGAGPAK